MSERTVRVAAIGDLHFDERSRGSLVELFDRVNREADVLACLFDGLSNKAIARTLFVSVDTVKTHLKHIYGKLDVTSRSRAVARARELGFSPRRDPGPGEPDGAP